MFSACEGAKDRFMKAQHTSRCLMCSLGCGVIIETEWGEAVNLEYDRGDPVSGGVLCGKGNYLLELINHPGRLDEPRLDGRAVSWKDALDALSGKIEALSGSVGLVLGGDASTEDVITAQLFADSCLRNNRVAVHFPTGDDAVYRAHASLETGNPSATLMDIALSSCVVAVGDPFEVAPVSARHMLQMKYADRRNVFAVVSAEPNRTSRFTGRHLCGDERTVLAELLRAVADLAGDTGPSWLDRVRNAVGPSGDPAVAAVAKALVETPSAVLAVETQDPVVAELAVLTAAAAGENAKLYFMGTSGNAGGVCEVFDSGIDAADLVDAAGKNELKAMIVLGCDLVASMPGRDVGGALSNLDFLAVGAAFPNGTAALADLVLPTALWMETEGTYNGTLLNPVIEPPGAALSYGEILRRLTAKLGSNTPPRQKEPVIERRGLTGDIVESILDAARTEAPKPAVRSSILRYGDGSLTDNMSWNRMQGRGSW